MLQAELLRRADENALEYQREVLYNIVTPTKKMKNEGGENKYLVAQRRS